MVLRFPSRTLSEKVATHMDKPEMAIGIEDPTQLPTQFRAVPPPPAPTIPSQPGPSQPPRAPRPPYLNPAAAVSLPCFKNYFKIHLSEYNSINKRC